VVVRSPLVRREVNGIISESNLKTRFRLESSLHRQGKNGISPNCKLLYSGLFIKYKIITLEVPKKNFGKKFKKNEKNN